MFSNMFLLRTTRNSKEIVKLSTMYATERYNQTSEWFEESLWWKKIFLGGRIVGESEEYGTQPLANYKLRTQWGLGLMLTKKIYNYIRCRYSYTAHRYTILRRLSKDGGRYWNTFAGGGYFSICVSWKFPSPPHSISLEALIDSQ